MIDENEYAEDYKDIMAGPYERYLQFNADWENTWDALRKREGYICSDESTEYYMALADQMGVNTQVVAEYIWYPPQRSWFKPEMMETLVDMANNPNSYEFLPIFATGDFDWDSRTKQFVPGDLRRE